jgi:chemotaxis-related protein WspD
MIDHEAARGGVVEPPMPECWRIVGVSGDRTCPELARFIHCRNCPVLAEAARGFFDRPAPPGYLEAWQTVLEEPDVRPDSEASSLLVFRIEREWLALPATALVEVTPIRRIHSLPHRGGTPLAGIVNIRGRLELCVSLHAVLGLPGGPISKGMDDEPASDEAGIPRLLVVERKRERATHRWVLGVDDVAGVQRVPRQSLRKVPSTVGHATSHVSVAIFDWLESSVALLDEERLFDALARAVVA